MSSRLVWRSVATVTEPLFPELVMICPDPPPPEPCGYPYFIVAYWPREKRWAIKPEMFVAQNNDGIRRTIAYLQKAGWRHITILRLPPVGPWAER